MTRRLALFCALACSALAQEPARLAAGTPVEREIRAGEVHPYRVTLDAGQFVHVTASQLGSDLSIRLLQPDGTRVTGVDRIPFENAEDLPWIATSAGEWTVEIRGQSKSPAGRYQVSIEVRLPTEQDRRLVSAFTASWIDGTALRAKQDAASLRAAVAKYEFAASEAKLAGDPRWEAFALSQCAEVLNEFGEFARARELLERSLPLRRAIDERYSLSVSLNGMGRMLSALGDQQRALESYGEALELRRTLGDRVGQAAVLTNMGQLYKRVSDFPNAIDVLTQALKLRKESGDLTGESITLVGLSDVHFVAGDFQAALDNLLDAWKLRTGDANRRSQATVALRIGTAYYSLGDSVQAQQYWKQAETVLREVGDTQSLAGLLYARGMDHARNAAHQDAIRSFEEAIALHQKSASAVATVNDLTAVCRAYVAVGQLDKARERAALAVQMSRKAGYKIGDGSASECLGRVEWTTGNDAGARKHFEDAVAVYRGVATREDLALALGGLASVERRSGNLHAALAHTEEANALTGTARAQINDPNLRATYRASRADRLNAQTSLLMALHRQEPTAGYQERAFNLAEQWQSRSLSEMIQDSRAELRQELTAEQRQREDRMLASITRLQRDLFQPGIAAARQRELKASLSGAERELNLFQAELRQAGNRYAAGQYDETLDAAKIRSQMLDPDTALVEYALADTESFAWVVTKTGVVSAVLPGRKEIQRHIETYRKLLSERVSALTAASALARIDTESARLYRLLVEPLESSLGSKKRLVIVPDGALAYLPFETLRPVAGPRAATSLIERFNISYAPSASSLAALRDREQHRTVPQRSLLAFADPVFGNEPARVPLQLAAYRERGFDFARLPSSRQEVAGIRSLFPPQASQTYVGADASEKSLRTEPLDTYRFLHFAVHGYFDQEQPSRSGLVLSSERDGANDGILQASEIMRLHLNADLVTLSACQTGLGELLAGEGVMGLTRAFFYAGAQSLVVSLWSVNDAATAELMRRFYANLKSGAPRDEALRQAKLSVMRTPGTSWRHPYYWAPFVFVGDPGRH